MDKIVMDDKTMSSTNFLGWALILVASEAAERRRTITGNVRAFEEMFLLDPVPGQPANSPHVFNVEMRINGEEVSFMDIIRELGRQHDRMIIDNAREAVRRATTCLGYNLEKALEMALDEATQDMLLD